MTVREAGKGSVRSGGGTYQIGYTDLYGMEHETELSAYGMKDLEELWSSLCLEFECRKNSIRYIVLSGKLNDAPSGRLFRADLEFLQRCPSL